MAFFSGLDIEAYDRNYADRELLARIAEYFRPQARRLLLISALVLMAATPRGG